MADLLEQMIQSADSVVALCGAHGVELDYSIDSLRRVDDFIEKYCPQGVPTRGGPFYDQTLMKIFAVGLYVGEVMRRNVGGSWSDAALEQSAFGYCLVMEDGAVVWPVLWAMNRQESGLERSLYGYGACFRALYRARTRIETAASSVPGLAFPTPEAPGVEVAALSAAAGASPEAVAEGAPAAEAARALPVAPDTDATAAVPAPAADSAADPGIVDATVREETDTAVATLVKAPDEPASVEASHDPTRETGVERAAPAESAPVEVVSASERTAADDVGAALLDEPPPETRGLAPMPESPAVAEPAAATTGATSCLLDSTAPAAGDAPPGEAPTVAAPESTPAAEGEGARAEVPASAVVDADRAPDPPLMASAPTPEVLASSAESAPTIEAAPPPAQIPMPASESTPPPPDAGSWLVDREVSEPAAPSPPAAEAPAVERVFSDAASIAVPAAAPVEAPAPPPSDRSLTRIFARSEHGMGAAAATEPSPAAMGLAEAPAVSEAPPPSGLRAEDLNPLQRTLGAFREGRAAESDMIEALSGAASVWLVADPLALPGVVCGEGRKPWLITPPERGGGQRYVYAFSSREALHRGLRALEVSRPDDPHTCREFPAEQAYRAVRDLDVAGAFWDAGSPHETVVPRALLDAAYARAAFRAVAGRPVLWVAVTPPCVGLAYRRSEGDLAAVAFTSAEEGAAGLDGVNRKYPRARLVRMSTADVAESVVRSRILTGLWLNPGCDTERFYEPSQVEEIRRLALSARA